MKRVYHDGEIMLNSRSKIVVRWTTNPANLGYSGKKTEWLIEPGRTMGIRAASEFAYYLGSRVGFGTYKAISYRHRDVEISKAEIDEAVGNMEIDGGILK